MTRHLPAVALAAALLLTACAEAATETSQQSASPAPAASSPSSPALPAGSTDASSTGATPEPTPPPLPESAPAAAGCVPEPMEHVYHPDRLLVLNPCVTVAGTIALVRAEADGDYHVRVALDPGQRCAGQDCLDDDNRSQQAGDLVVELVCEHTVTQQDAIPACTGYHNPLAVPRTGTHTTVTGPWVMDLEHGWNEIHPVESLGASPPPPAPTPAPTAATSGGTAAALSVRITASQYGYVAAMTSQGAVCSATATLPSGRTSTASGLQTQQTAGADGAVSWSYRTSSSTTPGTGTHTVTCTLSGRSASASAPFTVS